MRGFERLEPIAAHTAPAGDNGNVAQSTEGAAGLHVQTTDGLAGIDRIAQAWRALAVSDRYAAPFLQPEWVSAWWRAFGGDRVLHIVTAWQGKRLVGVLPLLSDREKRYGLTMRRLATLANLHTPRCDVLVASGVEGVLEALWQQATGAGGAWDLFEIPDLSANSATIEPLVQAALRSGCRVGLWRAGASPFIATRGRWPDYLASRSRNFRKDLRRKSRRLSDRGAVARQIVTEPSKIADAARTGFRIEADAWKGVAGTAILSSARDRRFYLDLARSMGRRNALRLHFLTLDGKPIAFDYSLEFGHRIYSLKAGYLSAYADDSPGQLLLSHMLAHYMGQDIEEIDLLGDQDTFKQRWTDQSRPRDWFLACAPTLRGRLFHLIKFRMIPAMKRLGHAAE
jgi:CelD/BcsL family acetyltransferase involved in cellulose biosynthesis